MFAVAWNGSVNCLIPVLCPHTRPISLLLLLTRVGVRRSRTSSIWAAAAAAAAANEQPNDSKKG